MLNTLIVGASGYTGAELALYINRHPYMNLIALTVSNQSSDIGKLLSDLHPKFKNIIDLPLQPLEKVNKWTKNVDIVFLATSHEVSHDITPQFLAAGCTVFDLSGAYRVNQTDFYTKNYGFQHKYKNWLNLAVYGLAEWQEKALKTAQLIAVPGCYSTLAQLAIKPLIKYDLLNTDQWPIINAISGVSGAGRQATLINSFCEVSLQPYNIFTHRHQPEISYHLGIPVIFIPHLGNFPVGILATITCKLKYRITQKELNLVFHQAYDNKPLIRLYDQVMPSLKSVINSPFCDIGFKIEDEHLILVGALDNLLKGAAAQAIQCANIRFNFQQTQAL